MSKRILLACTAAALAFPAVARADAVEDFYRGKQINVIIGYNVGDTYDIHSRLVATHLTRHMPGHPVFVPRNMPGVASLKAGDYLYNQAPRDGTTIGMLGQAVALEQALGNPNAQFDVRKFNWIGRTSWVSEFSVAWHTSKVRTVQDAMQHELVMAGTSPDGVTAMMPRLLNRIAGTKFKLVLGYQGISGSLLALERGEVESTTATTEDLLNSRADWLRDKKVSVLVQYSITRHAAFPDVPAIAELGRTPEETQILQLFGATSELGRSLLAPPEVPAERVAALRAGFDALTKDAAFLADIEKAKMQWQPLGGEALQKFVTDSLNVSPDVAARAAKAREP